MTNTIYTISFWDADHTEAYQFDNTKDCADCLAECLEHDASASYFVIKSTHEDGKPVHEDVTTEIYNLAAHDWVYEASSIEDVPYWATASQAHWDRFAA